MRRSIRGWTVRGTYDSSGKLQTPIEEGMEADVFMSAARQQMDSLAEEGFVDGTRWRTFWTIRSC